MARKRWISAAVVMAALTAANTLAPSASVAQVPATAPATTAPATTAPVDTAPAGPVLTPAERAANEVKALAETLEAQPGDATQRPYSRDEAARRLSQRGEAGDAILSRVLSDPNASRDVKVATLRAIASHPNPPAALVTPVAALLSDRSLIEPAADALAAYKDNPQAQNQLIQFARNASGNPNVTAVQRVVAIRALGTVPDPTTANALVGLLADKAPTVRANAADALAQMTGRRDLGRDPQQWRKWQAANANKPAAQWKADLLIPHAAVEDELRRRNQELLAELSSRLSRQFGAAQPADRPAVLLEFMGSTSADSRARGVSLLREGFEQGTVTITTPLTDRLIDLVGDSSRDVRLEAAQTLYRLNEARATDALLTQLLVERDEAVRAAIVRTLGRIESSPTNKQVKSVPQLRGLFNDPSIVVATAATDAIKAIGPNLRAQDPALAKEVGDDLILLIGHTQGDPDSSALRDSAIQALAPLRNPGMLELGRKLLQNQESKEARIGALRGLAELGDPKAADLVADRVDPNQEKEASVRWEAVSALGKVGGIEQADTFLRSMDPRVEPDSTVRDAARQTLQSLLPAAREAQLARVAQRFKNDPELHIPILQALAARLDERKDYEAVALTRQNIGVDYLALKKPADAVPYLQQAADYFEKQNAQGLVVESLIGQLMDSLLQSKQYPQAAAFGARTLSRDPSQQDTIGPKIKNAANRLQEDGDGEDALKLIDEALKMTPPLADRYTVQLKEIAEQARRQKSSGGAK